MGLTALNVCDNPAIKRDSFCLSVGVCVLCVCVCVCVCVSVCVCVGVWVGVCGWARAQ